MSYAIDKLTYSDGRAYGYHISDEDGQLRYVAERTGLRLPSPTNLVEFFDPGRNPTGRLQPLYIGPWRCAARYEVFVGQGPQELRTVIRKQWRLVDILLLRLPRYDVQLGQHRYVARGSRYGRKFYEILHSYGEGEWTGEATEEDAAEAQGGEEEPSAREVQVGQIRRQTAGPRYVVETIAAPLRQALLVLASLAILIDMETHS